MKTKKLLGLLIVSGLALYGLKAVFYDRKNQTAQLPVSIAPPNSVATESAAQNTTPSHIESEESVESPESVAAKIDQQIASYSEALKANANDPIALTGRAELYAKKAYYDNAVNDYSRLIMQDSKNITAYFYRAMAQANRGNLAQAIEDYSQVITLDPKNYLAYNNRGLLYIDKQSPSKAVNDFEKALTINPQYAQTYYNRALLFANDKNFAAAQQDLTQALSLREQADGAFEVKIRYRLAMTLYNQNNYQDALTQLNTAIKLSAKDARLYTLRASVHDQLGNKQQAFDDRAKAQELNLNSML